MANKIFDKYPDFSTGVKIQTKGEDFNDTNDFLKIGIVAAAQNAYQILKQTNSYDIIDFIGVDEFTDETGTKDTVNLGVIDEALGDTTHDPNGVTDPENAFDGNDSTFATVNKNEVLGKTFNSKVVESIRVFTNYGNASGALKEGILQTYDGSTWSDFATIFSSTETGSIDTTLNLGISVQGIRMKYTYASSTNSVRLYSLEYGYKYTTSVFSTDKYICKGGAGSYEDSKVTVNKNTLVLDGTETSITVYTDCVHTANTSMGVKAGNGTDETVEYTMKNNAVVIDITSIGSGNLELEFIERTSDTSETPQFKGYAVVVNRDID